MLIREKKKKKKENREKSSNLMYRKFEQNSVIKNTRRCHERNREGEYNNGTMCLYTNQLI